jgi:hypothetical protein
MLGNEPMLMLIPPDESMIFMFVSVSNSQGCGAQRTFCCDDHLSRPVQIPAGKKLTRNEAGPA